MRNFVSKIDQFCTFVLDETVTFVDPTFVRIQEALVITMGANPELMTPSEEGVLADFIGWVRRCKEDTRQGYVPHKLIFAYHNLSEGHSLAVVWTDSKRKLVTPANQTSPGSLPPSQVEEPVRKRGLELTGFRKGIPVWRRTTLSLTKKRV